MEIYHEYYRGINHLGTIYKDDDNYYGFSNTLFVVEGDLNTVIRELESFLQYKYKKHVDNTINV